MNGRLIERHALRPLARPARRLFVTPAIAELLDGNHAETGFPDGFADAEIARFLAGWLVVVSLGGRLAKGMRPTLERLSGLDEAWAFCIRRPRPG